LTVSRDASTSSPAHGADWRAVAALVGSMASLCTGASFAKQLFVQVGAAGTTLLRVGFAALLLLAFWRPWRVRWQAAQVRAIVLFGLVLGSMNLCFYLSLRTIPLGVAVALELSGPLAVAVATSRRRRDLVWIGCAVAGIALLLPLSPFAAPLDPTGVALALGAAAFWAAYILVGQRAAREHPGPALAWAMSIAMLLALPFGTAAAGASLLQPAMLLSGLALAALSSALPYSLEMYALRRLPSPTFGVLLSLEPVMGALAGLVFLHERLHAVQWLAIACVIVASAGMAWGNRSTVPPVVGPEPP
jgi:inner membrane transporter RhtA